MQAQDLLAAWNKREKALFDSNPERVPPLAALPSAPTAHMGRMKPDAAKSAALEGARTVPPREHGGNCDIKNLSRGSTVYFPVYVPGGGLSMGDIHFSQGDGEITFCGAIEMAGYLDLRVHGRAGIRDPGHGAGRGAHQRHPTSRTLARPSRSRRRSFHSTSSRTRTDPPKAFRAGATSRS